MQPRGRPVTAPPQGDVVPLGPDDDYLYGDMDVRLDEADR